MVSAHGKLYERCWILESFWLKNNRGGSLLLKSDIQGQYMGVLKIDRLLLIKLLKEYKNWVDSTLSVLNLKEKLIYH